MIEVRQIRQTLPPAYEWKSNGKPLGRLLRKLELRELVDSLRSRGVAEVELPDGSWLMGSTNPERIALADYLQPFCV